LAKSVITAGVDDSGDGSRPRRGGRTFFPEDKEDALMLLPFRYCRESTLKLGSRSPRPSCGLFQKARFSLFTRQEDGFSFSGPKFSERPLIIRTGRFSSFDRIQKNVQISMIVFFFSLRRFHATIRFFCLPVNSASL